MIIGLVPNECVHVAAKIEALEDLGFFFFSWPLLYNYDFFEEPLDNCDQSSENPQGHK